MQRPLTEVEFELAKTKRELAEVKMERDMLKKAAAYCQTFNQPCGRRQTQYSLGNEGARQHISIMLGTSTSTPSRTHKFLDTHPIQGMHHLHQFRRQCANFISQFRYQFVLNDVPTLHDSVALRSIHVGRR
jgi:hypothetical protein